MRFSTITLLLVVTIIAGVYTISAKKSPRSTAPSRRGRSSRQSSYSSRRPPISKRRSDIFDEDDEYDDIGYADPLDDDEDDSEAEIDIEVDSEEEDEEDDYRSRPRPRSHKSPPKPSGRRSRGPSPKKPPSRKSSRGSRYYEEEDDYPPQRRSSSSGRNPQRRGRGGPPPRRRNGGRGRVVPYSKQQQPSTFTRGLEAFRRSMPDPGSVKEAAIKSLNVARETTSGLSANLYRDVKGLTSSELEQVMLKATRPDDTPVKGKHAERLVGVTYQISGRYDIYDAVLRKLWAKMAEKDWRTTIKALYILHRFSADGSPEHALALKARVRELRRTRDPKRKGKFFSSKLLQAGDDKPETAKYRAFMGRYAHYVLLRAQCLGGMFDEIAAPPSKDKKKKVAPKPITSTSLRVDHLDAAKLLLKTGVACVLKDGEENENTALAVERVASDLLGLTSAVATALNRALKGDNLKGVDPVLIRQWCEFYSEELLPQTRAMVKQTTPKLDAYGLFLPSRMGASVSPESLQKGLKLDEIDDSAEVEEDEDEDEDEVSTTATVKKDTSTEEEKETTDGAEEETTAVVEDASQDDDEEIENKDDAEDDVEEFDEEYEYDEDEDYYDDEDEL
eukprot:CAMPEP_0170819790 /NCGR_PEP_ID=MMETSP0733-20121128/41858_1 /TAXON_ID=186038 /ORGANISM="Fragilariopsis kerguelensis, Strain L26-C5" /LENGTH=617 /DNA_ID=CAMNT_0011180795 /DNA_START=199 /DNA_END=2052 /DNA_ORIENTATION=+